MKTDLRALSRPALEQTCTVLDEQISLAKKKAEEAQRTIQARDAQVQDLETQVAYLTKMLYGKKSEKTRVDDPNQQSFLDTPVVHDGESSPSDEDNDTDEKQQITYERKKRRQQAPTKTLPEKTVTLEPSPADYVGPNGEKLVVIGYDESRQLNLVPEKLEMLIIKRPKMGVAETREYSHTIPVPPRLVPGGKASDQFMLIVALRKFMLGLPLYRQTQLYRSLGADLADNFLIECIRHIATAFKPIAKQIRIQVLLSRWIFADETPIKQMKTGDKQQRGCDIRQSYLWAWIGGNQVSFHFGTTRRQQEVRDVLGIPYDAKDPIRGLNGDDDPSSWDRGAMIGFVICDGYDGYNPLFRNDQIRRVACWVHARRGFLKHADNDQNAKRIVGLINRLFKTNKRIQREAEKGALEKNSDPFYTWIAHERQDRLAPLIHDLKTELDLLQKIYPPDSGLGPALTYIGNRWNDLQTFLDYGFLPMENNTAERAIRPIAVGRKNWLFVGSEDGGEWAATMFSLIESCRLQKIDITDYCTHILQTIVNAPDRNQIDYAALTPAAIKKQWKAQVQEARQNSS